MPQSSYYNPFALSARPAFVATYPSQQCGIATFTRDLVAAVARQTRGAMPGVVAVSSDPDACDYPREVIYTIVKEQRSDYRAAAEYLNASPHDVVCVQHEFGIFGGPEGQYLLDLMRAVKKPVVTTFHTVLSNPPEHYRRRLIEVAEASDAVVVLTPSAFRLLRDVYGIGEDKVRYIPHGIPDVPFVDPDLYKDRIDAEGRTVLMTFGLIGPSKGIDQMLDALPEIIPTCPDLLYMVVGATHPGVKAHQGENYRDGLLEKVQRLGLENNVRFENRFLADEELYEYLKACDIYVTPYLSRDQISSGTLSYAAGMGKAVVSTSYIYAEDLLADGRGRLVEFGSSRAMADAINAIILNREERNEMRIRAYEYGRHMKWPIVGGEYAALFNELVAKTPRTLVARPDETLVRSGSSALVRREVTAGVGIGG